jgi:hypothetical protein
MALNYSNHCLKAEVSLGFRTLKYSTTTNIYTGSMVILQEAAIYHLSAIFTPGEQRR